MRCRRVSRGYGGVDLGIPCEDEDGADPLPLVHLVVALAAEGGEGGDGGDGGDGAVSGWGEASEGWVDGWAVRDSHVGAILLELDEHLAHPWLRLLRLWRAAVIGMLTLHAKTQTLAGEVGGRRRQQREHREQEHSAPCASRCRASCSTHLQRRGLDRSDV